MKRKSRILSAAVETLEIRRLLSTLVVNGGGGNDTCVFEVDASFIYATMNGVLIPQPTGAWDDVQINLMGGNDIVTIINTGDEPVNIDLGSGVDTITVASSTRDLDSISSRVFVAAGTDTADDFVEIRDDNDTGSDEYDVFEPASSPMRLRKLASGVAGPDKVLWGEANMHAIIYMNDFANDATVASTVAMVGEDERLSFTGNEAASGDIGGSGGDDTLTVSGTISGDNFIFFHGGSGTDVMNVNTNSITSGLPLFQFQGGSGAADTLNITDPAATTRYSFPILNTVRFFEGATQTASFLAPTDVININSTHASQGAEFEMLVVNSATDVEITAGAGNDTMSVGDDFITTEFGSGVNIDFSGGTGVDALEIHDDSYNQDRDHTFASQSYNSDFLGVLSWSSVSSAVLFAGVGDDNIDVSNGLGLSTIEVNGNSGADIFDITPDVLTNVEANGGAPTTVPGDVLFITPDGATNGTFTSAGVGAGTFSYQGRSPIVVTGMEQLPSPPASAPGVPNLSAAQDSGTSSTDNITNLTSLTFTGSGAPGSSLVKLFRDGAEIATATPVSGSYTFSNVAFAAGDDTFLMTTRYLGTSTQLLGPVSAALSVRVDTVAPAAPASAPDMTAATDSGLSNTDNITNDSTPTFTGTSITNEIVRLFDTATLIGSETDLAAGYSITPPAMTDGSHNLTVRFEDIAGNQSSPSNSTIVTIDTVAPATPVLPDLLALTDTGVSNTDNITLDSTPVFAGASSNHVVKIFSSGTLVGSDTDLNSTYAITTSVLADGTRSITTRFEDAAGNLSAVSPTLNVTIDTAGPTVSNPQFNFRTSAQNLKFTYSENVQATLSVSDLTLTRGATTIPGASIALSYAPNTATFTFPGFVNGMLPNGSYSALIPGFNVTDIAGNPAANAALNFSFLQGDTDGNGVVDFDDYARIDQGFNNNLTGFENGDFDYNGIVDFDDYSIIDQAFNSQQRGAQTGPAIPKREPGTGTRLV
ncbi:MAG: hypothetical protein H7Z14_00360 [Anaerolineae bacterium]|nr:hypothetical protein [Phycisphaerae bacterium]